MNKIKESDIQSRDKNIKNVNIMDQNNKSVNIFKLEVAEQNLAYLFIKKDDIVL
jgi:hypothetical protein